MTTYERAAQAGETIGQLMGALVLVVVAIGIYAAYKVRNQRSLIRDQRVDPPWDVSSGSEVEGDDDSSELDEWDRRFLAGEISEAEWESSGRPIDD